MKLKYYGTGAAEGVPAMFCNCEVCQRSKKAGGKNIRTRSQACVDDKILIDFPADTYMHVLYNDLWLPEIQTLLITHDHTDHLYPMDLEMRGGAFSLGFQKGCLTVYGTQPAYEKVMQAACKPHIKVAEAVDGKWVRAFEPFEAEGYTITPLKASHDARCEPVFYLISKDGKSILYANDTGYFPEETWEYLKTHPVKLDLVSLDCTLLLGEYWEGHMNINTVLEVKAKLEQLGVADQDTVFVVNHFSHGGGLTYDETVQEMQKYNILVSYDGMEIEV